MTNQLLHQYIIFFLLISSFDELNSSPINLGIWNTYFANFFFFSLFVVAGGDGLPRWLSGKESACQCSRLGRHGFHPWVGKTSWRKGMVAHSSILAWEIPWTEEPGRLQSTRSQRVRHNWATEHTRSRHALGRQEWLKALQVVALSQCPLKTRDQGPSLDFLLLDRQSPERPVGTSIPTSPV